jgi:hypothetical protein
MVDPPIALRRARESAARVNAGEAEAPVLLPIISVVSFDGDFVADVDLAKVAEAADALGFGFGGRKRGQQERREDGNDGDDDEQLDESKRGPGMTDGFHAVSKGVEQRF